MTKHLTKWGKMAMHSMIDKDLCISDVAKAMGMSRSYISSVLNGRVYSLRAINRISDFLNIPNMAAPEEEAELPIYEDEMEEEDEGPFPGAHL